MHPFLILIIFSLTASTTHAASSINTTNKYRVESISDVPERQTIEANDDVRAYMHGINIVQRTDGHYDLVWSAAQGAASSDGNWNHDIYTAVLNAKNPQIQAVETLLSAPEAQEPVSVSQTKNGMRIYTFEDGNDTQHQVAQRFAIFDEQGKSVKAYPQTVKDGGHSGHTASTNEQHVIFWSDDWVLGGGVDNLGSGKEVWVSAFTARGTEIHSKKITMHDGQRDWWPMIAASDNNTMLLWQRFVEGETYAQLMFAIYDPKTNKLIKKSTVLNKKIQYYNYEVSYVDSIHCFVVSGTTNDHKGFLYVIDKNGHITAKKTHLNAFVREAKPAIQLNNNQAELMYPRSPSGFAIFDIEANNIFEKAIIEDTYQWQYGGTVGFYTSEHDAYFASLSKAGIVEKRVRHQD